MLVVISIMLIVASLIPIIPKQLLLDEMPHLLWIHGRGTVPSLPLTPHECSHNHHRNRRGKHVHALRLQTILRRSWQASQRLGEPYVFV